MTSLIADRHGVYLLLSRTEVLCGGTQGVHVWILPKCELQGLVSVHLTSCCTFLYLLLPPAFLRRCSDVSLMWLSQPLPRQLV